MIDTVKSSIKLNFLSPAIERPSLLRTFAIFYIYAALVAVFIQFIVLPYMLPAYHNGIGLIRGLDSEGIHLLAVDQANRIKEYGWGAWQMQPMSQGPAGIASIVYTFLPNIPAMLIPLNALVHALSGVILVHIYQRITGNYLSAFIGSIPFVVFPTSLMWCAQIHKDGYTFLGIYLIILGWICLTDERTWQSLPRAALGYSMVFLGAMIAWTIRPYIVKIAQIISVFPFLILLVSAVLWVCHGRLSAYRAVMAIVSTAFLIYSFSWIANPLSPLEQKLGQQENLDFNVAFLTKQTYPQELDIITQSFDRRKYDSGKMSFQHKNLRKEQHKNLRKEQHKNLRKEQHKKRYVDDNLGRLIKDWSKTKFIPALLEIKLYYLANIREGYRLGYPEAGSNIDVDISLKSAGGVFLYIPRAIQISLLAPFPDMWFTQGRNSLSTLMRFVSSIEMILVYVMLIGLLLFARTWFFKKDFWISGSFAISLLVAKGIAIVNLGTLHRLRYGELLLIAGVGLSCMALHFIKKGKGQKIPSKHI